MTTIVETVHRAENLGSSSQEALEQKLIQIFCDDLNLEIDDVNQDLIEDGLLDSLALVEMLLVLEEAFGVEVSIADIDFDAIRTVKSLANFVSASGQDLVAA